MIRSLDQGRSMHARSNVQSTSESKEDALGGYGSAYFSLETWEVHIQTQGPCSLAAGGKPHGLSDLSPLQSPRHAAGPLQPGANTGPRGPLLGQTEKEPPRGEPDPGSRHPIVPTRNCSKLLHIEVVILCDPQIITFPEYEN